MTQDIELKMDTQTDQVPPLNLGTILIIEDDPRMQKVLRRIFSEEHYTAVVAGHGQMDLFRSERPIAIVLDLILPHISGRELCQTFKSYASDIPIVVVSAITEAADKVLLLELGADDYVTKPFSPRGLMARVQAAIQKAAEAYYVHDLSFRRL